MDFIPHLNSGFFTHIRKEKLEQLKDDFKTNVYSTDDDTALQIDGSELVIIGKGDYWISRLLSKVQLIVM